jgi:hypothetical protein
MNKVRTCLLLALLLLLLPASAQAGAFDGLYDFSYQTSYNPYGGHFPSFAIERALRIQDESLRFTDDRATWRGTVDRFGGVTITGACPLGANIRVSFTGVVERNGTGRGTWICDGMSRPGGTWSIRRVSGGGSDFELDWDFDGLGIYAPLAMLGLAAGLGLAVMALMAVRSPVRTRTPAPRGAGGRQIVRPGGLTERAPLRLPETRPLGYATAPPSAPPALSTDRSPADGPAGDGQPGAEAASIQGGTGYSVDTGRQVPEPPPATGGQPATGPGASVGVPEIGPLASLNGTWAPGTVTLTWGPPQFDPATNILLGYDILRVVYTPNSTVPVNQFIIRLPPNATAWVQGFAQSYNASTGGDLVGFRVEPLFGKVGSGPEIASRVGGLFLRLGATVGTPGL